ncbi:MAG: hypothetical protein ACM3PY_14415 [Omnitrophica WOR_2 bacterium]
MQPSVPATPMLTFVLRFQRETTAGETRWRGSIEHVQSGEAIAFMDFETMLRFLRRFGIRAVNPDHAWHSPEVSEQ